MNYYIHKNKIVITNDDKSLSHRVSVDFNDNYECYITLNDEQISYYLNNPELSGKEIYYQTINPIVLPNITELINTIYRNYELTETSNITPAGAIQLFEWCMGGNIKALAVKQWLKDLYSERDVKLSLLENGDINVDLKPSQPTKPYTFRQMSGL